MGLSSLPTARRGPILILTGVAWYAAYAAAAAAPASALAAFVPATYPRGGIDGRGKSAAVLREMPMVGRIRGISKRLPGATALCIRRRPTQRDAIQNGRGTTPAPSEHSGGNDTNKLIDHRQDRLSRRMFMASVLTVSVTGALLAGDVTQAQAAEIATKGDSLPWKVDPVNKRYGVTVSAAERAGYNVAFVTYLSRFLLNFDPNCQRWWFSTRIPKNSQPDEIEQLRIDQFAAFAASVEVSLIDYATGDGPKRLLEDLVRRYGFSKSPDSSVSSEASTKANEDDMNESQRRLARSARRHIALLFGLLENTQPVAELSKLLASVDNGSVTKVQMMNGTLSGYEADKPPKLVIPPPEAGENYVAAEGRAVLRPTGRLLRIDIIDAGSGYSVPPVITISAVSGGTTARAQAKTVSFGANKGSIERIQLMDSGSGFADTESIQIQVSRPKLKEGRVAVLSPVLDMAIDRVEIINGGTGYAVEKPLKIFVEQQSAAKSDLRQVGFAYPTAEKTSFAVFRRESDQKPILDLEEQFKAKYNMKPSTGAVSGSDSENPPLPFWSGGRSSSAELLRLLPAGIGLEFDSALKRYVLAADTEFLNKYPAVRQQSSNRPIGFEYGPRGRAPIERDMKLGLDQYLRLGLSGAICCSGILTALTPLDVVKTKVQVDPVKYPNIGSSFGTVWDEEGPSTLFTGWLPTFLGHGAGGAALYAGTEFARRSLSEAAGADAVTLEVPIILFAAAIAATLNSVAYCPFDAVRIRTVAQPEYAVNSVGVLKRMLKEEGFGSLVNAIPVYIARNIPYAMVKFLVFDLSTEQLYAHFPAAQEDLKLSLLVSLVGGILGGCSAAVISNPADVVISELKKAKSDTFDPLAAVNKLVKQAGPSAFFVGLPLRLVYYSLVGSITFSVYDGVRFLLGVGSDDLKLYLDVLGGALSDSPLV